MDWLNIHTVTLDSPAFIGAEPVQRATWLCLMRLCVGQENGGKIIGAKSYTDRKWQQLARVTIAEVLDESDLWAWDGDDLVVSFYPKAIEESVQQKRKAGKAGGAVRSDAKALAAKANGSLGGRKTTQAETQAETQSKPKQEPNEREREREKEMEMETEKEGNDSLGAVKTARKQIRFIPPSVDEVAAYCQERGNSVDAQRFVDYYESNGWKIGKVHMKSWQAAVRTWERNSQAKPATAAPVSQYRETLAERAARHEANGSLRTKEELFELYPALRPKGDQ